MMRRIPQYLRIAFSATCLIACVLLILLWARSYYYLDVLPSMGGPNIASLRGQIFVNQQFNYTGVCDCLPKGVPRGFTVFGYVIPCDLICLGEAKPTLRRTAFSDWVIFGMVFTLGAIPWIPCRLWLPWYCRFSLRTLLVVTTLIALALGAIMYVVR